MATAVPLLDSNIIKWGEEGCIIDCNWHYGCIFSPKQALHNSPGVDIIREVHNDAEPRPSSETHIVPTSSSPISPDCLPVSTDNLGVGIAEEDVGRLGRLFQALDEDGDGRLSTDEIMRFLERLGLEMAMEELKLIVGVASGNGDEYLTAMEFVNFYETICFGRGRTGGEGANGVGTDDGGEEEEEEAIREAFGIFDQDGDGLISAMELADVLCRLRFVEGRDLRRCQRMIESVDHNGDGFVDLQEFKQLMTRNSCYRSSSSSASSPMAWSP